VTLRALGDVTQAVNSTIDLPTVLSTIVAKAVQLSGTEGGAIYVFDGGSQTRKYLTTAEIERLMAAARKSSRYGHRDAAMILIGYRHGSRASELCDLQWSQVELATGRLHIRRAKNDSPSVHPMQGDEIRALRRLQREQGLSSHVFMTERDSRVGGKKLVDRLSTKAKVEGGKSLTSSAQPPPTS